MSAPAAAPERHPSATRFALAAVAWLLGVMGVLRLPWVEAHVVLPLTRLQGWLATGGGAAPASVVITTACSGTDVVALVAAAVLAYPAPRRRRIAVAIGGACLLLALNTLRISTLDHAAGTPAFGPLHSYVWPAVLAAAAALYALGWMWSAGRAAVLWERTATRWLAAGGTMLGAVCAFAVLSPVLERSAAMGQATGAVAWAAASLMNAAGLAVHRDGSVLATPRGAFLVTPECLLTPLIPVYLAAGLVLTRTWRSRFCAVLAALPVFAALAVARLFTLAVPVALGSSLVLIHGFHQLALGAVLVLAAGLRAPLSAGAPGRRGRLLAAIAAIAAFAAGARPLNAVVELEASALAAWIPHTLTRLHRPEDAQGALALLPAYQLALFSALWLAWSGWRRRRELVLGLAATHAGHLGLLALLGQAASLASVEAPVTLLRAWAVLEPLALFVLLATRSRTGTRATLPAALPA